MSILENIKSKLHRGVIVSVQASAGEPLNHPEILTAMALSVLQGGACAVRMANTETEDNIRYFKSRCPDVAVIGITKPVRIPDDYKNQVYITPHYRDIERLLQSGADVVALDATMRVRPPSDHPADQSLRNLIRFTKKEFPWTPLMADISTVAEGLSAEKLGFDLISTTLSGYTMETSAKEADGPDFELLESLVKQVSVPVILEGRVWTPGEVTRAFELGAYAVVIGSAVTRPHTITRRFCQAIPGRVANY